MHSVTNNLIFLWLSTLMCKVRTSPGKKETLILCLGNWSFPFKNSCRQVEDQSHISLLTDFFFHPIIIVSAEQLSHQNIFIKKIFRSFYQIIILVNFKQTSYWVFLWQFYFTNYLQPTSQTEDKINRNTFLEAQIHTFL